MGLFLHDRLNGYQLLMLSDAEQAAVRHGLRLTVESAEKDADRQVRQVRDALALPAGEQPSLVLVSPVRDIDLLPLVTQAARQGVAWAFLTRWLNEIPTLRELTPEVDVFSVSQIRSRLGEFRLASCSSSPARATPYSTCRGRSAPPRHAPGPRG